MAHKFDLEERLSMKTKRYLLLAFITSILFFSPVRRANALNLGAEISKELICTCGCGKIVYDCYCDLAKDMRAQVDEMVAQGMNKKEVLNSFVEKYGDGVLATPSKSGLELVLWLSPVVAAILGTLVIYRYARDKAPIPDREVSFPIRDVGVIEETVVIEDTSLESKYGELFDAEYRKFKEKQKE